MTKRPSPFPPEIKTALGTRFRVRVKPAARFSSVTVEHDEEGLFLVVATTALPEDGEANAAIVKLVAQAFGIAPSRVSIRSGAKGRSKLLSIDS